MQPIQAKESLPIGTTLHSPKHTYKIESVLGIGRFDITYRVSAEILVGSIPIKTLFCVKECYMADSCERDPNGTVMVSKPMLGNFKECLNDFKAKANRLNALSGKHDCLVRVNEVFCANNTAYYVIENLNGTSLREAVDNHGSYKESEALCLIEQVGGAVKAMHSHHISHLDINPDNIILHTPANGEPERPVLIGFGLSKHYDSNDSPASIIRAQGCTDGFSPIEQYIKIGSFSPESDVYALAATLFFLLTGETPLIATDVTQEYLLGKLAPLAGERTIRAITNAMKGRKENRTPSIDAFLNELSSRGGTYIAEPYGQNTATPNTPKADKAHNNATNGSLKPWLPKCLGAAVICALAGYFAMAAIMSATKGGLDTAQSNDVVEKLTDTLLLSEYHTEATDAIADDAETTAPKESELQLYIDKAKECCDKAEHKSGNKAMIQVLLDAKYYYYDKAQKLHLELYGTNIKRNVRLDRLVKREYDYWVDKGNKMGKSRKNFAQKKAYYQNAYKLVASDRVKSYIDWLDKQISKRK